MAIISKPGKRGKFPDKSRPGSQFSGFQGGGAVIDNSVSKGRLWTSIFLSGLVIITMLFDSLSKLMKVPQVVESGRSMGLDGQQIVIIGLIGLAATILYAMPLTSVLGAVLLTGYYGGAVCLHFVLGNPVFTHILFPVYIGLLVWGSLCLRSAGVREVILGRRTQGQVENR
ncbi:DoxX family protein [Peribacillus sp. SCS-26]|uniref:DoxX family protein n=1 Tax=Paraperibacillus marinus TaxID=3115295 RepID=UPI003905BE0B